jgi:hypothetical protein
MLVALCVQLKVNRGVIRTGPRDAGRSAPYTFVTAETFLVAFRTVYLRDLPDRKHLADAGLASERTLLVKPKGCGSLRRVRARLCTLTKPWLSVRIARKPMISADAALMSAF